MKSIFVILAASCSVLGSPRPQHRHHFLGSLQSTQLPPIRAEDAADQASYEARNYQYGYHTGYHQPVTTQLPPIRADEAADQASYEARTYQTGYRLQNTGYRPLPEPQPANYQPQPQDYGQYGRGQNTDYRSGLPKDVVPILTYSNDVAYDGSYSYNYETADGISKQETGVMTNSGTEDESPSVRGSYSYTAPDGTLITVNYIADKDGFRAEGAHLPTPPPIPEAIAKSLEYIARVRAAQPAGYEEDGQYQPDRPFRTRPIYPN